MLAAWFGHSAAVELLLAVPNISINAAYVDGHTALMMVILGPNDRACLDLLKAAPGMNIHAQNKDGLTLQDLIHLQTAML